jgi:hypothetical protein
MRAYGRFPVTMPQLSDLDGLIGLSRYDGVDIRPTLLRVLTDIYVLKPFHSPDEERHFTELALRLIDGVDIVTRKAVADRLIRYPAAPLAVIRHLARDIVQFATLSMRQQSAQTEAGLQGPPSQIAHDVIARLRAPTPKPTVPDPASKQDADQADPDEPNLGDVFYAADAEERRLILLNLDFSSMPVPPLISHLPASATIGRLEAAALAGRPDIFIRELEHALALPRAEAEKIVNDTLGEPIAVAAKAIAMPLDIFQRVLLFVNPAIGRSIERVYSLSALYHELTGDAALRLLTIWRQPPRRLQPRATGHQPVLWDDAHRGAREAASIAPHRLAAPSSERERPTSMGPNARQRTT